MLLKSSVHSRQTVAHLDLGRGVGQLGSVERFAPVGEQQPIAAARDRLLAIVGDVDHVHAVNLASAATTGTRFEKAVGHVKGDDAAGFMCRL